MMIDPYGRPITSLRITLTQRCNLNCFYCHREGEKGSERNEMTAEEFDRIGRIAAELGIKRIKLTGGEPLLRNDILEIVQSLAHHADEVSMTTNGTLLEKLAYPLKEAGLARVNVSLDTLSSRKYMQITNNRIFGTESVMRGIKKAIEAGLNPVKVNTVLLKGINDSEIEEIIDFTASVGAILQLIEFETTRDGEAQADYRRYHADLRPLEARLEEMAEQVAYNELHRRKKYLFHRNGRMAEVEVVRPMHNSIFCANCKRIRLTSDGHLRGCLLTDYGSMDLLTEMRAGASDEKIKNIFKRVVAMRRPYWSPEAKVDEKGKNNEGIEETVA